MMHALFFVFLFSQARAELERFASEREVMREKKQSANRKEEQVRRLSKQAV